MSHSAKITSRGEITLPAEILEVLNLQPGDLVDFVQNATGGFELRRRKETLADLRGVIKLDRKISGGELEGWIHSARDAGYRSEDE